MTVPILFVGDFPTEDEAKIGVPFIGGTGRLFGQMLRLAKVTRTDDMPADFFADPEYRQRGIRQMLWERSDFAFGNVFSEPLPGDDLRTICAQAPEAKEGGFADEGFYVPGGGFLRPECRRALDRLSVDVGRHNPTVIVPLGGIALWAFTGHGHIMESRGTTLRATRVAPGVKLVPTLHPDVVQADFRMLNPCVGDIVRALREASDPERIVNRRSRELWIEPTLEDLDLWWRMYGEKSGRIATDIETPRGQISCISFDADSVHSICVPFIDWRKPDRSYWPTADQELVAWEWVQRVLGCDTPKVLQNGTFDIFWLLMELGIRIRNYRHDTRLMGHSLQPEMPKSLAFLGSVWALPPGPWKTMRGSIEKRDA